MGVLDEAEELEQFLLVGGGDADAGVFDGDLEVFGVVGIVFILDWEAFVLSLSPLTYINNLLFRLLFRYNLNLNFNISIWRKFNRIRLQIQQHLLDSFLVVVDSVVVSVFADDLWLVVSFVVVKEADEFGKEVDSLGFSFFLLHLNDFFDC